MLVPIAPPPHSPRRQSAETCHSSIVTQRALRSSTATPEASWPSLSRSLTRRSPRSPKTEAGQATTGFRTHGFSGNRSRRVGTGASTSGGGRCPERPSKPSSHSESASSWAQSTTKREVNSNSLIQLPCARPRLSAGRTPLTSKLDLICRWPDVWHFRGCKQLGVTAGVAVPQ